ncbi:MAG TPA: sigma-54 dependent transcriptional regulator [candidate division Zixibacteria bacterium]
MTTRRITVLLVDDDPEIAQAVANFLSPERFRVEVVGDGALVLSTVRHVQPDVILLDVHLPSISGLDLLKEIKATAASIPVIIVSGHVSTDNAIEAMKQGAFEYVTKPFRLATLEQTIIRACGRAAGPFPRDDEDVVPADGQIIGKSPEIVAVAKMIGQVADADAPVLLMGESGTGKELVARAIHRNSRRAGATFCSVSCAASNEDFLEAELFGGIGGSERGRPGRAGKLEEATGGTVFLDEIADLSLLVQSRLFRVLDDNLIEHPGTHETIHTNVRIIAATSQSLVDLMKEGRFRVDLFYKLKVVSLFLPPLRERKADIRLLSDYFIRKYSRLAHRPPKPLASRAYDQLLRYHWPGNVRELENAIHTAVVLAREAELIPEDFPMLADVRQAVPPDLDKMHGDYCDLFRRTLRPAFEQMVGNSEGRIYTELTAALDEALVEAALEATQNNQVRAAQLLGISRNTLRERMRRFSMVAS